MSRSWPRVRSRRPARPTPRSPPGAGGGPLHGVTVALKDIYDTEGVLTAGGSRTAETRIPARDAETVRRLKAAGAIVTGKLTTHEFAHGGPSFGPALAAGPQPLACRAFLRRLLQRLGRRGGGRPLPRRARHRHRRLHPGAGGAFRRRRADAEHRPGEPPGRDPQLLHLRPLRAARLDRRGLRPAARRARRPRCRGPALARPAGAPRARLHGGAAHRPPAPFLGGGPGGRAGDGARLGAYGGGVSRPGRGGRHGAHPVRAGLVRRQDHHRRERAVQRPPAHAADPARAISARTSSPARWGRSATRPRTMWPRIAAGGSSAAPWSRSMRASTC